MTITTSYTLSSLGSLQSGDFSSATAITGLSDGGFMTAGNNPFRVGFLTFNDIDLRPYDGTGGAGDFAGDATGGKNPSIAQLSSSLIVLPGGSPPNLVMAYENGDQVAFSFHTLDGVRQGDPITLTGAGPSLNPDVATIRGTLLGGGSGFALAYEREITGSGDYDTYVRFYSNSGTLGQTRSLEISADIASHDPKVTQLDNGNVAVTWTETPVAGGNGKIMYAVFSRNGATTVKGPTVLDDTGNNRKPAIVATDDGFAILYHESNAGGGIGINTGGIRLASIDGSGTLLGSRSLVSASSLVSTFSDVDVARLPDGLLAFSYTVRSGLVIVGTTPDTDVMVRITGQGHGDSLVSAPVEILGTDDGAGRAIESALARVGVDGLAVIYENDTTGKSEGEVLRLVRVLTGDDADDVFTATARMDSMIGGNGVDTADYSAETAALGLSLKTGRGTGGNAEGDRYVGIENLLGGSADDLLAGDAGANRLKGNGGNDTLRGNGGNDKLEGSAGDDLLRGNGGHDKLLGGAGADRLFGDGGNDTLTGGAGADTLKGQSGHDRLEGGGSADSLLGGKGNDTLAGGTGADTLNGELGNDVLQGGDGGDILNGGKGNDTVMGGRGNDRLTGGDGADLFIFGAGHGRDVITDFRNGVDKIDLQGGLSFGNAHEKAIANGVRLTFDGHPDLRLDILGVTPAQIEASDFL